MYETLKVVDVADAGVTNSRAFPLDTSELIENNDDPVSMVPYSVEYTNVPSVVISTLVICLDVPLVA